MPALARARTRRQPGSLISGVPASLTSATHRAAREPLRAARRRALARCARDSAISRASTPIRDSNPRVRRVSSAAITVGGCEHFTRARSQIVEVADRRARRRRACRVSRRVPSWTPNVVTPHDRRPSLQAHCAIGSWRKRSLVAAARDRRDRRVSFAAAQSRGRVSTSRHRATRPRAPCQIGDRASAAELSRAARGEPPDARRSDYLIESARLSVARGDTQLARAGSLIATLGPARVATSSRRSRSLLRPA